jgi:NADH:ubiquinone oxidoreductase subunit 2 (subunit N)
LYDKSDTLGLSSCFILLGSALLYASCGLTSLDGIYVFYNIISGFVEPISTTYPFYAKPEIFSLGFLIISVGYLFKVSAAPWVKLSKSGNPLKLLVPSNGRKATGG